MPARLWDGAPLPAGVRARLEREWQQVERLTCQIRALDAERRELLERAAEPAVEMVRRLLQLRGIGPSSAWLYVTEFFAWRRFQNRREVGALAGLTPTPYQNGRTRREQGIAEAGNPHVRTPAVEIAWGWLHWQPASALSCWYQRRFGRRSSRLKRVGIVAPARKLLIALWRYVETGMIPEGAVLKV